MLQSDDPIIDPDCLQDITDSGLTAHSTRLNLCSTSWQWQVRVRCRAPSSGGQDTTGLTTATLILILTHMVRTMGSSGLTLGGCLSDRVSATAQLTLVT